MYWWWVRPSVVAADGKSGIVGNWKIARRSIIFPSLHTERVSQGALKVKVSLEDVTALVYDRNSFLFNIQKQIYCTQIFTENLFNRKIKYITVTNRNTLIFCLFLLFPWFVSVGLSVSFLFYTNEQQKMNRKPISCFCSVSTIQFSVATETKITERNKQ